MLNFEYIKSNFVPGCPEFNLVMKSNNCVSLPFQGKKIYIYIYDNSTVKIF